MTALAIAPTELTPAHDFASAGVIHVHRLTKRYAVRRSISEIVRAPREHATAYVLRGVTFHVNEGEFFGLLGPNGAGKTTLLRILATLILPDEGSATVGERDVVRDASAVRREVALVLSDERGLYWRLSAYENLRLFATLHDLHGREMQARIGELLSLVGLADAGSKLVGAFSSGMRQRLLIARGLLRRPRVLLLDEPTRSLDPVAARDFRHFLVEDVATRAGCTIVLATHSAEEAFGLCTRIGILDRGRLLDHGTMGELARHLDRDRYRVWTRTPGHRMWDGLDARPVEQLASDRIGSADGWTQLEVTIPGGMAASARVLSSLAGAGVVVGRFEQVPYTLADVIESAIAHDRRQRDA
ncbi:MAG TPA: ABC transporter ATP-binding protein [Gemmatimonadaceae bacterium]